MAGGRLACCTLDLRCPEARLDGGRHRLRDAILQVEHVVQRAVEAIGPDMAGGFRFDQLAGDPQPGAGAAHATFQHVAHAELAAHLTHIHRTPLVGEGRIAGDDEEPAHAGERGCDVLDHAVGEVVLLRVAAHVLEGQHHERWLVRQAERTRRGGVTSGEAEDADGAVDVLQALRPGVDEGEGQRSAQRLCHGGTDRDTTGFRQAFDPDGDVNAIPEQVAVLDDDIAQMHADPQPERLGGAGFAFC